MLLDRTNHNRFAADLTRRLTPAPEPVPATDRTVTRNDNRPPEAIDHARDALSELSAWLRDNPVIEGQAQLKAGTALKERTLVALNEARAERETKTKPWREKLNAIFAAYELVKDKGTLERAYSELRKRLTNFANEVEARRIAEANRLRHEAEERARIAREAELAEQDAIACADVGECTDVAGAIEQADSTFSAFQRADRQAAIAEKNVPLRTGSVLGGRSISMRTTEKLVIENVELAISVIGLTEKITEAILSSARDFRKERNELPPGITATFERSY